MVERTIEQNIQQLFEQLRRQLECSGVNLDEAVFSLDGIEYDLLNIIRSQTNTTTEVGEP